MIAVEVKATIGSRFPSVELTANEWSAEPTLRHRYQLALVSNAISNSPSIEFVKDPHELHNKGVINLCPVLGAFLVIQIVDSSEMGSI